MIEFDFNKIIKIGEGDPSLTLRMTGFLGLTEGKEVL
jgi:hypothetical protein